MRIPKLLKEMEQLKLRVSILSVECFNGEVDFFDIYVYGFFKRGSLE